MTQISTLSAHILLAVGLLFFLSVFANRISDRLGVPTLLAFLFIGMLAGSDGLGFIYFDNPRIANFIGVFAMAYILFSGGLDTDWRAVRPVLWRALTLSTFGVVLTASLVGLFVWGALGFPAKQALLLGAIVSSTDAAAVFAIMRSRGVGLKGYLKPLLELESGSNDPMALFLTIAVIDLIMSSSHSWLTFLPSLVIRMSCGIVVGGTIGLLAAAIFNRLRLEYEGLYPVLSMSFVLLTYGLSESLYGNGFLAVYTCGIVLGSKDFVRKHYLTKFHDGLGWLMQIILFLALGLLVFPSQLPKIAVSALLLSAFLMFGARPIAVYIGLWRSKFTMPERTLIAWTGLRGAVPIVLATFPFLVGYEHSYIIFNIVFFVVLTSALLQGKTLMLVAGWLGVDEPLVARPHYPIEFEKRSGMQSETREVDILPDSAVAGRQVFELGLPSDVLILLIRRGEKFVVPKGKTTIEAFDSLMLLAGRESLHKAQAILRSPKQLAD